MVVDQLKRIFIFKELKVIEKVEIETENVRYINPPIFDGYPLSNPEAERVPLEALLPPPAPPSAPPPGASPGQSLPVELFWGLSIFWGVLLEVL